jgi:hypothetical protein
MAQSSIGRLFTEVVYHGRARPRPDCCAPGRARRVFR